MKSLRMPLVALLFLLFAMFACGEDVTPEKVGEVAAPELTAQPTAPPPTQEAPSEAEAETEAPPPTESPDVEAPASYKVGDIVAVGDMVVVVLGWESPQGDEFSKPEEGNRFITIDVLLVNRGEETDSVSSMLQMSLKDDTGQQYDIDLMASLAADAESPDGEIAPGERLRGKAAYQTPQDATGLVFVFDADLFGAGKVFVELGPEPIAVEVPSDLAGEQDQVTYAIGDIIEAGDMVMVVLGWESPQGDEVSKPEEGNRFIAVDVLLVNRGEETDSVSSMLQMSLKDDTGQQYDIDLMASLAADAESPDGEIAPGERLRGKAAYQTPQDATGLVFVFDADLFGAGKVFVELGPDPIAVPVPSDLEGEQEQVTYAIGDMIEVGDLAMTINDVTFPKGDEFNKPDEGKTFVAVDVTVENRGSDSQAISSMMQMYLKDATGQKYQVDLMAAVATGGSTPDGEIVPGEKLRGQVGFQVPEDASGLVFVFDADFFGHGKVFVALP